MRGLGFDGGFDEGCGKSKIVDVRPGRAGKICVFRLA